MTISLWPLRMIALLSGLALASPTIQAHEDHDHKAGHSHNDGHKHMEDSHKMHGEHGEHGDKHHDGDHEKAGEHAKHHPKPAHGGVVLEIHDHHGELVAKEGKIALYMSDHDGHAAPAKGFSATAMVLGAQGRQGPITLAPAGDNKLESTSPVKTPAGARIIITLKDPHGHMTQARYQMP